MSNQQLDEVLDDAWSWLKPESEEILSNMEMLPVINNVDALPYRDREGESLIHSIVLSRVSGAGTAPSYDQIEY